MNTLNSKYLLGVIMGFALYLISCSDESVSEKLGHEAKIMISFKVTGTSGTVFNSSIGEDTITIKVSPYMDAEEELKSATPMFYLSKGSTVTPDPSLPQNFAQDGGVKYTVTSEDHSRTHVYTVIWGVSDKLPYGEGFSYAEVGTHKFFTELGYPGTFKGYETGENEAIRYGDLQMYHAYCGDYIVLLSRAYIDLDPKSPHCVKVVDKTNLNDAGSLNLGTISLVDMKMITSDYRGRCVAAVVTNDGTEFFYWNNPSDNPISLGKINVNIAPFNDSANNFQVAGDVTVNAWITALAPRDVEGTHYRIKVTDGRLASSYSTIKTGYMSDDCSQFQMISPMDDSDQPNYAIGDAEGTIATANSIHCYVNSFAGSTLYSMPPYWQNILQAWWVGTGFTTNRPGGRSPVVSALPINGKTYVTVTSGTAWWFAAAVLTSDLQELAHENLNIATDINRGWSFGEWVDWYWDEKEQEAYLAVWFGRYGLSTYKMTCYE